MNSFTRSIVLPIISAGILAGAALGLAGMANAEVTTTETSTGSAIVASPDTTRGLRPARCRAGVTTTGSATPTCSPQ